MPAFEMAKDHQIDQDEKPVQDLMTRDLVDLYVGSENTHWIIHEKLLCERSGFFKSIFRQKKGTSSPTKSFGLPDEEDKPFREFVGWLYSGHVLPPKEEGDLTTLFDLYLMGEKWAVPGLERQVLDAVRTWYHHSDTYPGLRRVQYIYANTSQESPMRSLLVNSIARMLALGDGIPKHWDKALRKNGQLAVDLMMCVQSWKLDPHKVPDLRDDPESVNMDMENIPIDTAKVDEEIKKVAEKNNLSNIEKMGLPNGISKPKMNNLESSQLVNGVELD